MLKRNIPSVTAVAALLLAWQGICTLGWIPPYMLPSPVNVLQAFLSDLPLLWENAQITLQEAFIGLALGVGVGFSAAVLMDAFGVVALVAMTPLITIQLLGFGSLMDRIAKERKAMKRILDADDQQIINFM